MSKRSLWILMAVFAVLVGLYPAIYFFIDRKFGLLSTKPDQLLANIFWNIGFYVHIVLAGLALLIGWAQFSTKMRNEHLAWHKRIGNIYVVSALCSSIAAFGIAFFASGGFIASAGFISLAIIWFYTTLSAYLNIRSNNIEQHKKMMVYSYAACFAGVTLRTWLPLLIMLFSGNFILAYTIVAWLCWIPNLFVARFIVKRLPTPIL
jgi:uncharacterized membrane protein